jgi:hypothetical protein
LFIGAVVLLWRNVCRQARLGVDCADRTLLVMGMSVAADTHTEDLAALWIGLLFGASGLAGYERSSTAGLGAGPLRKTAENLAPEHRIS